VTLVTSVSGSLSIAISVTSTSSATSGATSFDPQPSDASRRRLTEVQEVGAYTAGSIKDAATSRSPSTDSNEEEREGPVRLGAADDDDGG
jgi:hypothetical protein